VCEARASRAFCCCSQEKPIAPVGCKFCYRGPGTSPKRYSAAQAMQTAKFVGIAPRSQMHRGRSSKLNWRTDLGQVF
jgi:hypothetical protein